jgi:hypothetical protein
MAKRLRSFCRSFIQCLFIAVVIAFLLPYAGGTLGYSTNFGGVVEQLWLDQAIDYLTYLREDCPDEELCGILDYTISRYHKIGPFDVAVSRCDYYPFYEKTLGVNNPLCPGVTLDIDTLTDYTLHDGAMILVHEALHDYPPYLGHSYVYPMLDKLEDWSEAKRDTKPMSPNISVQDLAP